MWGVPYSYLSLAGTLRHIDRLIEWGQPGYFITANLNYNMLTDQHSELRKVNDDASFIVCDGMPMIWRPLKTSCRESVLVAEFMMRRPHPVFEFGRRLPNQRPLPRRCW